jgi:hypothetical protein
VALGGERGRYRAPDSASPIRGAPATAAICMPIARPRSSSGAPSWRIVPWNTAEMTSAQPATASGYSAEPPTSLTTRQADTRHAQIGDMRNHESTCAGAEGTPNESLRAQAAWGTS